MHQNTLVKEMYKQNLPNHREVQTYIIVKITSILQISHLKIRT